MTKTRFKPWTCAAGLALCLVPALAQAQPDPNVATKAENPPNWERGNRGGRANLTPEQRAERQRQGRRQALKSALTASGIVDAAIQDAVVFFAEDNQGEQAKLSEAFRTLDQGINGRGRNRVELTDDQVTLQLKTLRDAVQAEKKRRAAAEQALEAKVHYTQNARLYAFLITNGLLSDDSFYAQRGGPGGALGAWLGGRQGNNGGPRNRANAARPAAEVPAATP